MRTLELGSNGQDVLDAQCALTGARLYSGDLDGFFGPQMQAAVTAFQKRKQLPVTAAVDAPTASALDLADLPPVRCAVQAITPELIAPLFSSTPLGNIHANLPYVLNALAAVNLCDKQMLLMALATIRVETEPFLPISEFQSRLNTSPGGRPFDLYDQRTDLGNQGPPDGANFRGRGFVQLTGRTNYDVYGQAVGQNLIDNPLLCHRPDIAAQLLAGFLETHESEIRNALAAKNLAQARRLVNGGSTGLVQFQQTFLAGSKLIPDLGTSVKRPAA